MVRSPEDRGLIDGGEFGGLASWRTIKDGGIVLKLEKKTFLS